MLLNFPPLKLTVPLVFTVFASTGLSVTIGFFTFGSGSLIFSSCFFIGCFLSSVFLIATSGGFTFIACDASGDWSFKTFKYPTINLVPLLTASPDNLFHFFRASSDTLLYFTLTRYNPSFACII